MLISTQHQPGIDAETLIKPDLIEHVITPLLPSDIDTSDVRVLVNPTGNFELGGPYADCGLTGRKIIVDTYGGAARHGGGAFSGKDPSKVDRSAAYAARWVAKNVVAAGAADRCEVQVAYAIGVAQPVSILVETFGTENVDPDKISEAVRDVFDLRPAAIIRDLDLRRPIYQKTAAYGHFGREDKDLTWEHTTRVDDLKSALGSVVDSGRDRWSSGCSRTCRPSTRPSTTWSRTRSGTRCASATWCASSSTAGGSAAGSSRSGVEPPDGRGAAPARQAQRPRARPPSSSTWREWAAWRWAGRPASLLRTASPDRVVAQLPAPAPRRAVSPPGPRAARDARSRGRGRCCASRRPPTSCTWPRRPRRSATPSCCARRRRMAATVAARLRRAGVAVAVAPQRTGRAARPARPSSAPGPRRGRRWPTWPRVVVLDEHDEAHQQEQAPTWHARDVAIERARRAGVPCVLTSPCPTLEALAWGDLHAADRARDRAGWPPVEVVDRRDEDPRRAGLFSAPLVRLLRSDRRVLCVLNRTGRAQLLACAACGELARCAALRGGRPAARGRRCAARGAATTDRRSACSAAATRFKNARAGVTRVREELEALVGEPVARAHRRPAPTRRCHRVVVGTEAVLQRIDRADAVAFLDLDQELLAPRYRAAEQALALVARAARVVGRLRRRRAVERRATSSCRPGSPEHEVVQAAVHADVAAGGRRPSGPGASCCGSRRARAMAEVSGAAGAGLRRAPSAARPASRSSEAGDGPLVGASAGPPRRSATRWPRSTAPAGPPADRGRPAAGLRRCR